MKLNDDEIMIILKAFTPKELLDKYMNNKVFLTKKQCDILIKMKSGERKNFMTDREMADLEETTQCEV